MRTYIKYYFHIVDVEVNSEYDFEAYFEEVQMEPEDLPRI